MKLDFTSLEQSVLALRRSLDEATPLLATLSPVMQDTVKSGIIQHFEVAYEQCWKAMKRWLENNLNPESVDGVTRRELFRLAALTDNGWTRYHRLLQPGQHHEAISTRPRLLGGAARQTEHAGQRRLNVRLSHAEAPKLPTITPRVSKWLQHLLRNAPQWTAPQRWSQIVARVLKENYTAEGSAPLPKRTPGHFIPNPGKEHNGKRGTLKPDRLELFGPT